MITPTLSDAMRARIQERFAMVEFSTGIQIHDLHYGDIIAWELPNNDFAIGFAAATLKFEDHQKADKVINLEGTSGPLTVRWVLNRDQTPVLAIADDIGGHTASVDLNEIDRLLTALQDPSKEFAKPARGESSMLIVNTDSNGALSISVGPRHKMMNKAALDKETSQALSEIAEHGRNFWAR